MEQESQVSSQQGEVVTAPPAALQQAPAPPKKPRVRVREHLPPAVKDLVKESKQEVPEFEPLPKLSEKILEPVPEMSYQQPTGDMLTVEDVKTLPSFIKVKEIPKVPGIAKLKRARIEQGLEPDIEAMMREQEERRKEIIQAILSAGLVFLLVYGGSKILSWSFYKLFGPIPPSAAIMHAAGIRPVEEPAKPPVDSKPVVKAASKSKTPKIVVASDEL